ncbi:hypothetical protein A7M79_00475 [Acinetobacter baumannii]|uniref:hypothetical protein n=1 Tax=Acinetobacter baumannii TaxID=470 RepID=UPI0008DD28AA|nr:hypothetical protein [Acinetobacter baumannii]OIH11999.1 hypothetical protein A7M79_00475 [Acinetobacter baumannii]
MEYVLEVGKSKKTTKKDSEGNPLLSMNLVAYFLDENKEKGEKFFEQKVECSEIKKNVMLDYYNAVLTQTLEALKNMMYCRDQLALMATDISRTEQASIMTNLEKNYLRELSWVVKISNMHDNTLNASKLTDKDIIDASLNAEIMFHGYNLKFDKKYKF